MNLVDLIVVLLGVAAAFRGRNRGLLAQVFELGGGFIGLIIGVALGPRVAALFIDGAGLDAALVSLFVVFAFLSIGQTVGFMVGHRFSRKVNEVRLGPADRWLGAGFGVVVLLISFWLVGSILVGGPSRPIAKEFRGSAVLKALNGVFPDPPNVLAYIRQYLDTSGFPQVFTGMPPVSAPVELPSNAEARAAIDAVKPSTVRVVIPACGGTQLGSGWVPVTDYVVTNAHVVAGGESATIQAQSGSEVAGTVVFFDPRTDIAILYAPGLDAPAVALDTTEYDRGEPGATLGYPGAKGGTLAVHRAAVQETYDARGRDIYGRSEVTRRVYELRSPVRQGDSGGPFALPNGKVAGVVFAASTTDKRVGYALTGSEVLDEIEEGTTRTEATSTGRCTH